METATIKQKLHQYIDNGDDRLLKMMLAMAKEYKEDNDWEYEFSAEEIRLLDERREKRLNGETTLHTWEEVKSAILDKSNR